MQFGEIGNSFSSTEFFIAIRHCCECFVHELYIYPEHVFGWSHVEQNVTVEIENGFCEEEPGILCIYSKTLNLFFNSSRISSSLF